MGDESLNPSSTLPQDARVPAGLLPGWTLGNLPRQPQRGWRSWVRLVGPGVLLAGASVGSGEWLFGPAVSAQYGGTLLWLAGLSIIFQVFCNLEMMRYAVYCGESIIVGYLRTWPGPRFWMIWYAILDLAAIWPFNASNAAVPLAAAVLGHLPGLGSTSILGIEIPEWQLVKVLGYGIFLAAFVPLIFGGTIYRILERVMTIKLVLVLGYLVFFTLFTVSGANAWEVISGFFRVGTVPLRAETIIVGRHFTLTKHDGPLRLTIKGTMENDAPLITAYLVDRGTPEAPRIEKFNVDSDLPTGLKTEFQDLTHRAVSLAQPNRFTIADEQDGHEISMVGTIDESRVWHPQQFTVALPEGQPQLFQQMSEVPEPFRARFEQYLNNQGLRLVTLPGYFRQHGALPPLDWAMLASFAAIAGAGGLSNTLFSNFARDAGWGMGARVGTIPSFSAEPHQPFPLARLDGPRVARSVMGVDAVFGRRHGAAVHVVAGVYSACAGFRRSRGGHDRRGHGGPLSPVQFAAVGRHVVLRIFSARAWADSVGRPDRAALDRHYLDVKSPRPADVRRQGALDLLQHSDAVRTMGPGCADALRSFADRQDRGGADEYCAGVVGHARGVRQPAAIAPQLAIAVGDAVGHHPVRHLLYRDQHDRAADHVRCTG
jgi:hypothetical protein